MLKIIPRWRNFLCMYVFIISGTTRAKALGQCLAPPLFLYFWTSFNRPYLTGKIQSAMSHGHHLGDRREVRGDSDSIKPVLAFNQWPSPDIGRRRRRHRRFAGDLGERVVKLCLKFKLCCSNPQFSVHRGTQRVIEGNLILGAIAPTQFFTGFNRWDLPRLSSRRNRRLGL